MTGPVVAVDTGMGGKNTEERSPVESRGASMSPWKHVHTECPAHLRMIVARGDPEAFASRGHGSQPVTLFCQWKGFHGRRGLALRMDLGVDNGHALPPSSKFLINSGVQPGMFVHDRRATLSAKALVAKIPQMPLSLNERAEGRRKPSEGRFPTARREVVFALQAEPIDAPPADEEVSPSHRSLRPEGRADSHWKQVGMDGCALADTQKKFGDRGKKGGVSVLIVQMTPDGRGVKSRGFDCRTGIGAREHVRRLLIRGPAQWAGVRVKMAAFEELGADT